MEMAGDDESGAMPGRMVMGDGNSGEMMPMYFHNKVPEQLLFRRVVPSSGWQYAGLCLLLVMVAGGNVLLKVWRLRLERAFIEAHESSASSALLPKDASRFPSADNARRAAIALITTTTDYALMLVVMTLNVGYFCSVVAGHVLATFCFGHLVVPLNGLREHSLECC
mmetsp:Transcript_19756/g.51034  ORF Transcript_19756/g.51034 Transcript_19756/m.51034 type:complete len:167 (+) Transcript_19756:15-515(+)